MIVKMHNKDNLPDRAVSDIEAGEILGLAPQTLKNMRCKGTGPKYSKYSGRAVRYKLSALQAFMDQHEIDPAAR